MTPVVLVLAGGASNRFWPLVDKPLLELGERTLLERHLQALADAGVQRMIIVFRPGAEAAIQQIALRQPVECRLISQPEALGMADAVLRAKPALESFGEVPLYVTQAQDVLDGGLHRRMLATELGEAFALLAAARVHSYFPGGYLTVANSRVVSIVEKPRPGEEPSDLVNLVAHFFSSWRPLLDALEKEAGRPGGDDAYERALAALMQERIVRPVEYDDRWEALKYPWQALDVMTMLLERWADGKESPGEGYEQREDGVFIGANVRIFPGAHVVGPALIGRDSVIGHNALVRGSLVSPKSVVGFGSEVARSYLGAGVELHHNYVGDSVLGPGSSMGFGGTTANFRLDGRTVPSMVGGERVDSGREKLGLITGAGVKIGVNTSTMPGIKIGPGAIIGPNLVINRDVPDGERVLTDEQYRRF